MDVSFSADDLLGESCGNYPWSDGDDAIKSVLMVGATRDQYSDAPLCHNDQRYLRDLLKLAADFKLPVSRAFNIQSSNLFDGEDFLRDYGLYYLDSETPPAPVDAIIFCYLYYSPHAFFDPVVPHTRQSPYAGGASVWRDAVRTAQPKVMLNISDYDELPTRFFSEMSYLHAHEQGKNHLLVHEDWGTPRGIKAVPDTSTHFADHFSRERRRPSY